MAESVGASQGLRKRLPPLDAGNTAPIRFTFNFDSFTADPTNRTCYVATPSYHPQGSGSYIACNEADRLTPEKDAFLRNITAEAAAVLSSALGVESIGTFKATSPVATCDGNEVPAAIQPAGSGIASTDIYIFVTAHPSAAGTLALAGACSLDANTKRPLIGFLNYNPSGLNTAAAERPKSLGMVVHELLHALGFNSLAWSTSQAGGDPSGFFDRAAGSGFLPLSDVRFSVDRTGASLSENQKVWKLKTPTLLQIAREHFNCPTLDGVEIEQNWGASTAGSHWERRILNKEVMIGFSSWHPYLSKFTLALLQDLGFYYADLSKGNVWGVYQWGRARGCEFVQTDNCGNWPAKYGLRCTQGSQSCTNDRRMIGACNAVGTQAAEELFRWNPNSNDELSDYCTYVSDYSTSTCQFGGTVPAGASIEGTAGQTFGETSRCFRSNLREDDAGMKQQSTTTELCYEARCTGPDKLKLRVGGYWFNCPWNTNTSAPYHGGVVVCPEAEEHFCVGYAQEVWPEFVSIYPASGMPGDRVLILGNDLQADMEVWVGNKGPCTDIKFDPAYAAGVQGFTCNISTLYDVRWMEPTKLSVVLKMPANDTMAHLKRSATGGNAFTISLPMGNSTTSAAPALRLNWAVLVVCMSCCLLSLNAAVPVILLALA